MRSKRFSFYKAFITAIAILTVLPCFCGCDIHNEALVKPENRNAAETEAPLEEVTLTVVGSWEYCRALDAVAVSFKESYPNCTVVYEMLQDYSSSVVKRLEGDEQPDLFFTVNIQSGSDLLPYALDIQSRPEIDLSSTFDGLIDNFRFRETDGTREKLYAIPLGAEMRGMYINVTLLKSLGLTVPTNSSEFLECCETLKENGYIPLHGNPSQFGQYLCYPWVANCIANAEDYDAAYNLVNSRDPSAAELIREPFEFLYELCKEGYYDYKTAQTESGLFTESTNEDYARYFLNITEQNGSFEKSDDIGCIAFMPAPMSIKGIIDRAKDDYHSEIEYIFVPSPIGSDGGYAYLSPAHGIAVNKNSERLEYVEKFINYLFTPENNRVFASLFNVIPNDKEAFSYIRTLYELPDNHVSQLGQVTFGFDFYKIVLTSLVEIAKCNNPQYMNTDADGSKALYPFDYYFEKLAKALAE